MMQKEAYERYLIGMKKSFEQIDDGIYCLRTPFRDDETVMTLILGGSRERNILIDTGANELAIREYLIPALKGINMTLKNIGVVTFTHCHPDNIGGLHTIKTEVPDIRVVVPQGFGDIVRNPMYYIMKDRETFPNNNPIFEEIRGVYISKELTESEMASDTIFGSMRVIPASGHDTPAVCWYHKATGTLICGDAFQGNGNSHQGMPFYKNISEYKQTLNKLKSLSVKRLVPSRTLDGVSELRYGTEKLTDVISRCEECVKDTGNAINELLSSGITDIAKIAAVISEKNFGVVPETLCYAMHTVSAHINEKVLKSSTSVKKATP